MADPIFIDAAINGVVRKEHNPNVPRLVDEIRADIGACFDAGASVVHPHEPDGANGPTDAAAYAACWEPVLDARPWAMLYPTVGSKGSFDDRFGHIEDLAAQGMLRVGPIDAGSTNLGVLTPAGVPAPSETVYENSYAYIAHMIDACRRHALAPTFAIFEPTFLHTVVAYWRAGQLPKGAWLKFYMAGHGGYPGTGRNGMQPAPFGLPPTVAALDAYLEILGDCTVPWGVSAMGADLVGCGIAAAAIARGGHIHVGLEAYGGAGTPTNAELVSEVVELAARHHRAAVRGEDAAAWLGLD
ncbi:MAG TPA: 3-keto-5-aminohexanoate cleavage protein [Acidimicrobiales bacterium]|nr:3-keto-5-aminohexanoate cleavage protein [Acidimicrobiales bacterium]